MNPDNPTPREILEARLTALLLGELPADEAAALLAKVGEDAELTALYARLEKTIPIVRATAAQPATEAAEQSAPLQLSAGRREKLLAHFKTVAPKEFEETYRQRRRRVVMELAAAIAILGVLSTLFLPALAKSKAKAQRAMAQNTLKQTASGYATWENDYADKKPAAPAGAMQVGGAFETNGRLSVDGQQNAVINNLRQIDGSKFQFALQDGLAAKSPAPPAQPSAPPFSAGVMDNYNYIGVNVDQSGVDHKKNEGHVAVALPGDSVTDANGNAIQLRGQSVQGISTADQWSQKMHNGAGNLGLADGSVQQTEPIGRTYRAIISADGDVDETTAAMSLPGDRNATTAATKTLSGYVDTSMNWNTGSGDALAPNLANNRRNLNSVSVALPKEESDKSQSAAGDQGRYYTGLTRDDVSGINYFFSRDASKADVKANLSASSDGTETLTAPTTAPGNILIGQGKAAESMGLPPGALTSDNPDVLAVQDGTVTGVRRGNATLSATLPDGSTVSREVAVQTITPVI